MREIFLWQYSKIAHFNEVFGIPRKSPLLTSPHWGRNPGAQQNPSPSGGEDGRGLPLTCHDNIPKRIICIPKEIRKKQKERKFYIIICFRKFRYFRVFSESKNTKKGSISLPSFSFGVSGVRGAASSRPRVREMFLRFRYSRTPVPPHPRTHENRRGNRRTQWSMSHATGCCQGGTQCGQHCNDNLYYCFPKIFFHDKLNY